ncbi:MAG TPA: DUF1616 domain-containing protein [Candidatus Sulfotelmatobacter sp.]|nr:DUF1616 domain-containing protein [Candidatus Sulfotelmatobacter sp.]
MNLKNMRRVLIVSAVCTNLLVVLFLISTPELGAFLSFGRSEPFSELYLLNQNHMMKGVPFNVKSGQDYLVYIGVNNHLSSSAYYEICVKFSNEDDQLPNTRTGEPSPLSSIYTQRLLIAKEQGSELPLTLSIPSISFSDNKALVNNIIINGYDAKVDKAATWNATDRGFYYQIFFELWLYDAMSSAFRFNNRTVGFWFNMTQ